MYLRGEALSGQLDDTVVATGKAELRQLGSSLKADRIALDQVANEIKADGEVRLFREGERYSGPSLRMKLGTLQGEMDDVQYEIAAINGRGTAKRAELIQPQRSHLTQAVYTTCPSDRPAWAISVRHLLIDQIREVAETDAATLTWNGTPILPLGDIHFSLSDRRRSGFLPPRYSVTSRLGLELTTPYYWDIAPNRDLTLYPSLIARRGLQLGTEFRFLESNQSGEVFMEGLPQDRDRGGSRGFFSLDHRLQLPHQFQMQVSARRASDDDYLADFGDSLLEASQRTLATTWALSGPVAGWSFQALAQRYQLLQDPDAPVLAPYALAPKLVLSRTVRGAGLDWQAQFESARFDHPTLERGLRSVAQASAAWPLELTLMTLTPRVGLHATRYTPEHAGSAEETLTRYGVTGLGVYSNNVNANPQGYSRALPTMSLDAQMLLERPTRLGERPAWQTLEPRLLYSYTPYRDQSRYPVFDSSVANLSLSQIFSDASLNGQDRVPDQNQLTAGLVSRIRDAQTGQELFRASVAQRFYFDAQRVVLPGQPQRTDQESDLLTEVAGRAGQSWRYELITQYTRKLARWQAASAGIRYDPRLGTTASLSYRFVKDALNSVDFAMQMPVAKHWSVVSRYNLSIQDRREGDATQKPGLIEALLGVEYDGGCWAARMVLQRFATGAERQNTAIFLQIELNGLGRIGTDPLSALSRSIPNYRPANQQRPLPARFEHFE
ncbi:MAG: LPS-assembly protein LptD [Pseudomonadota bacterium]|jgi:LPS-assembly protein